MQSARINGQIMHFCVSGPQGGHPVVLANSLGTDLRVWDPMLPHMAQDLTIIRYDKRGHGLSAAPPPPYHMGDLVQDAAGLMDHLGIRGATFVGLSIGGLIAQGLAAERPDLVRNMVLMDTAARIGNEEMWETRIADLRASGLDGIADGILDRWFSRRFLDDRPVDAALWRAMLSRTPLAGYIGCCQAIATTDLWQSTPSLALPTLVLAGSEDGATPPDLVRETADAMANATFHLIQGAGHLPCVEAPGEVATLVCAFIRAHT